GRLRVEQPERENASSFLKTVGDPAPKAFLSHLARGERHDDACRLRLIWYKSNPVLAQEGNHRDKGDALVTIDERMVLGEAERISRCKARKRSLLILPFVDRP